MKATVMKRGDEYGAVVIKRIQPITDLVVNDYQYYDKCFKKV